MLFLLKPQRLPPFIGILGFNFAAISTLRNKIFKLRRPEYVFNCPKENRVYFCRSEILVLARGANASGITPAA
jgi:hypothetical protein